MTRFLITGGAGLIGSALVETLAAEGDNEITVIDNMSSPNARSAPLHTGKVSFLRNSVDAVDIESAVGEVDVIVHLAATVGVARTLERGFSQITDSLAAVNAVVRLARRSQAAVIYGSSSEVYGLRAPMPVCEDSPPLVDVENGTRSAYALAKLASEAALVAASRKHDFRLVTLRFFNVSGPRQHPSSGMVIPSMAWDATHHGYVKIVGDGSQSRTFLHVVDAARALQEVALRLTGDEPTASAVPSLLNIGGTEPISILDLARMVSARAGAPLQPRMLDTQAHYGASFVDTTVRRPCLHRAFESLRWRPVLPLSRIVSDVVESCHKSTKLAR